jgi:uncharacterized protein YdiU (UPF0061 family)
MLGDGRAVVWGEHITKDKMRFDIQFKGSGKTPYSRRGDGKAALGPMLREYIISEAMHYLNIPTTRSLAVAITGEQVMRETPLTGAILTRVASSHIRVGTFEYAAALQDRKLIKAMMDYSINRHFLSKIKKGENRAISLIKIMIESQLNLIVNWMRVGFIHGVMNTDNMTISGETIDYGPCAFMDPYDPKTVFSSIDRMGRYAYCNQPAITKWNLSRFAECLIPFIDQDESKAVKSATEIIETFGKKYEEKWLKMMRKKLGLLGEDNKDKFLIVDLLTWMHQNKVDYTNTFCHLMKLKDYDDDLFKDDSFQKWKKNWLERLKLNNNTQENYIKLMRSVNPLVIPRNHKIENALEKANDGNLEPFNELLEILKAPYNLQENISHYLKMNTSFKDYKTFCGT